MIHRFLSRRFCCVGLLSLTIAGCATRSSDDIGFQQPPRYVCYPGGFVFGVEGVGYVLQPDPMLSQSFDGMRPKERTIGAPYAATADDCVVDHAECVQFDVEGQAARIIFPATPDYEHMVDLAGWKVVVTPMYLLNGVFTVRVETADHDGRNPTIAVWESGSRGVVWFDVRIPTASDETLREISCSRVSLIGLFSYIHFPEPTGPVEVVH